MSLVVVTFLVCATLLIYLLLLANAKRMTHLVPKKVSVQSQDKCLRVQKMHAVTQNLN